MKGSSGLYAPRGGRGTCSGHLRGPRLADRLVPQLLGLLPQPASAVAVGPVVQRDRGGRERADADRSGEEPAGRLTLVGLVLRGVELLALHPVTPGLPAQVVVVAAVVARLAPVVGVALDLARLRPRLGNVGSVGGDLADRSRSRHQYPISSSRSVARRMPLQRHREAGPPRPSDHLPGRRVVDLVADPPAAPGSPPAGPSSRSSRR